MKIHKIDTTKQKIIITGLITSDDFCKEILPVLNYNSNLSNELFSNYYKIVYNWCGKYYEKYQKSPKKFIQDIFQESSDKQEYEEEEYNLISAFLSNLSDNYEREKNYNEQYIIDQSLLYLRKANLSILKKQINENDIEQSEKYIEDFRYIKKQTEQIETFDLFENIDNEIRDTFSTEDRDTLFKMPGALGDILHEFERGDLVSFTAPAKRGKSWALLETGIIAMRNHLRVAFFSFEMSKKQNKKRLYQNLLVEVKRIPRGQKSVTIKIPKFEYDEELEKYTIKYEEKIKKGVTSDKLKKKIIALKTHVRGGSIKFICPPANSMTVKDIENTLDDMVLDGFVPDVLIFDYADIILPKDRTEYRHQLDSIWKGLKGIANKKHCLVVTATHSNKSTYEKDIGEGDVVEDTRKMNHVATMIALNQKAEEKKMGIMRASILAHRHEEFNKEDQIVILQNLNVARFFLASMPASKVHYKLTKKK